MAMANMKAYLKQNKVANFSPPQSTLLHDTDYVDNFYTSMPVPVTHSQIYEVAIQPSLTASDDPRVSGKTFIAELVQTYMNNYGKDLHRELQKRPLQVIMKENSQGNGVHSPTKFCLRLEGTPLTMLRNVCGADLRVVVRLDPSTDLSPNGHRPNGFRAFARRGRPGGYVQNTGTTRSQVLQLQLQETKIETREMALSESVVDAALNSGNHDDDTGNVSSLTYCEDDNVDIPREWSPYWNNNRSYYSSPNIKFCAKLTIGIFSSGVRNSSINATPADPLCVIKRILSDQVESNATIVAKNGAEVKCHKNFLAAHSSVFAAMFLSDFKESKSCRIEMVDMTEDGVKAFLSYLYIWDLKAACKKSLIALELFEAGHKYDISSLEQNAKKVLLIKPNSWYGVDVALRLFLFSRNLEGASDVKTKSIQVLKSKFKELQQSKEYQELFSRDPGAAMELCAYAFSI